MARLTQKGKQHHLALVPGEGVKGQGSICLWTLLGLHFYGVALGGWGGERVSSSDRVWLLCLLGAPSRKQVVRFLAGKVKLP